MALSVIHFRMYHGKDSEPITFSGDSIKLLDLKKEIVEKKKISGTLDFDLKISDENNPAKGEYGTLSALGTILFAYDLEYIDDEESVPKNASVIVKRVPAKSSKAGLMARINNRGMVPAGGGM